MRLAGFNGFGGGLAGPSFSREYHRIQRICFPGQGISEFHLCQYLLQICGHQQ